MHATIGTHHSSKRNLVPLSSNVPSEAVATVYDAVRHKPGDTIVRAGKGADDSRYVYMPKKESRFAAATYKAASIQRHRQQMAELLTYLGDGLNMKESVGNHQRRAILELRKLVIKKDLSTEDFTAKEIVWALKPLNDHVKGRRRLEKVSAIRNAGSPMLKSRRDYLNQFLRMSDSDLRILQQALFANTEKTISFQEKKIVLQSMFALIKTYLKAGDQGVSLAELVRQSPHRDLLLKFASAWFDHVNKRQPNQRFNLLMTFSWQKTMTSVCQTIQTIAREAVGAEQKSLPASPDRSALLTNMIEKGRVSAKGSAQGSAQGSACDTPTKLTSSSRTTQRSAPLPATPSSADIALQTVPKLGAPAQLAEQEVDSSLELEAVSLPEDAADQHQAPPELQVPMQFGWLSDPSTWHQPSGPVAS